MYVYVSVCVNEAMSNLYYNKLSEKRISEITKILIMMLEVPVLALCHVELKHKIILKRGIQRLIMKTCSRNIKFF